MGAVVAWESGDPTRAEALPARAGSPPVAAVFLDAMLWAEEQLKWLDVR
jgi:hypothetical protein